MNAAPDDVSQADLFETPARKARRTTLTFEEMPGGPPFTISVKRLLKIAGRSCWLRCVEIHEMDE